MFNFTCIISNFRTALSVCHHWKQVWLWNNFMVSKLLLYRITCSVRFFTQQSIDKIITRWNADPEKQRIVNTDILIFFVVRELGKLRSHIELNCKKLTAEEMEWIETTANEIIRRNTPVNVHIYPDATSAKQENVSLQILRKTVLFGPWASKQQVCHLQ